MLWLHQVAARGCHSHRPSGYHSGVTSVFTTQHISVSSAADTLLLSYLMIKFQLSYLAYWLSAGTNLVLAPRQIPSYFTFDLDFNPPLSSAPTTTTLHNFSAQHQQTDVTGLAKRKFYCYNAFFGPSLLAP